MGKEKQSSLETRLQTAITQGKPDDLKRAIADGADVTGTVMQWEGDSESTMHGHKTAPLLLAAQSPSAEVMDMLLQEICRRSQISYMKSESGAWNEGLRTLCDSKTGEHLLQLAAQNPAENMLATVWRYFRDIRKIDEPFAGGQRLLHAAAGVPENVLYLLEQGANVNAIDDKGVTPLMKACRMAKGKFNAWALLRLFEEHHADFHAVDNAGHNLIFHAFGAIENGVLPKAQLECLKGAVERGVDALARDKRNKTALDYFAKQNPVMLQHDLDNCDMWNVMIALVEHGYGVSSLVCAQDSRSALLAHHMFTDFKSRVEKEIASPGAPEKLWNEDGKPSKLLIKACGYELLGLLFEQPALKQDPARALALYQKMEETLPPQCRHYLHNGLDTSAFRREAEKQRPPTALDKALQRKKAPGDADAGRPPGRQP